MRIIVMLCLAIASSAVCSFALRAADCPTISTSDEQTIDESIRVEETITMDEYLKRLDKLLIGKVFSAVRDPKESAQHVDIQNWSAPYKRAGRGYTVEGEYYRVFTETGEVKHFSAANEMYESDGKLVVTEAGAEGTVVGLKEGGFRTKWYKDGKLYLMRDVYRDGDKTEQSLYFPTYLKQPAVYHEVAE